MTYRFGWRPQKPDHRDFTYSPAYGATKLLPRRTRVPEDAKVPIYDQGDLGSCTGNAIAAADHIEWVKQGHPPPAVPSRLMIYWLERQIEGTIPYDAGAEIRDGFKALSQTGTCFEDVWPYDVTKFTWQPGGAAYAAARHDRALFYAAIQNNSIPQMKACLASGYPFVFGFTVFDSFMSNAVARTGVVPMPGPAEGVQGGHAVLAVGYDDAYRAFCCRNSWGTGWGDRGRFYIPFEYLGRSDLSSDFWTLRSVG